MTEPGADDDPLLSAIGQAIALVRARTDLRDEEQAIFDSLVNDYLAQDRNRLTRLVRALATLSAVLLIREHPNPADLDEVMGGMGDALMRSMLESDEDSDS